MSRLDTQPKDITAPSPPVFFLDQGGTFATTGNQTE